MIKKVIALLIFFVFVTGCSYLQNYIPMKTVDGIQEFIENSVSDYLIPYCTNVKNYFSDLMVRNIDSIKNKFFISGDEKKYEYETTQLKKIKDDIMLYTQIVLEQIYYNDIQKEYFNAIYIDSNNGRFMNNIGIPVYYKNPYQELWNKLAIKKIVQFSDINIQNRRHSEQNLYKIKQFVFISKNEFLFVFFTLVNNSKEYNMIAELNNKKLKEVLHKPYVLYDKNKIKQKLFTLFLYIPLHYFSEEIVVGYYRKQSILVFLPYLISFGIALILLFSLIIVLISNYIRSVARKKILIQNESSFILEKDANKLVYEPKSSIIKNHGDNDKELNTVAFDKEQVYNNTNDMSLPETNFTMENLNETDAAHEKKAEQKGKLTEEVRINDIPPFQ